MPRPTPTELRAVLDDAEITLGDCITAFATDETNPYVQVARAHHREGVLEIGEPTTISQCETGAYVLAWLWVPTPEEIDGDSCTMPLDESPQPPLSQPA